MAGEPSGPESVPSGRAAKKSRPRRRWRRIALWGGGGLVLLVVILLLLAPTIAGSFAPGIAESNINKSITGHAQVKGASFSWFGGQNVGPVTIYDKDGAPVATVKLSLSRGLLGLARSGLGWSKMDLGRATVTGTATIVRYVDGTTNLQRILQQKQPQNTNPPSQPSTRGQSQPAKLPPGLTGDLVLDKLDVQFIDEAQVAAHAAAAVVRIPALSGTASITNSSAAAADLAGDLVFGPDRAAASTPGGRFSLTAKADSLTDAQGYLTPEKATIDAKADMGDVAVVIADSLAGMNNKLVAGVGEKLQASIRASGTMANADAAITASSRALAADLTFKSQDGVLTAPKPGSIRIQTAGMAPLIPGLEAALNKRDEVAIDRLPDVQVALEQLRIPLPINGKPLDLRGGAVALAVSTSEVVGQVRVPASEGAAGRPQPFRIAPASMRLESADLAKEVTLKGGTAATISGQSAGTLAIDLAADHVLDAAGKPRAGLPGGMRGGVELNSVATAIAQPFVDAAGIDLAKDVGPQLDLALRATTDPQQASPASQPAASESGSSLPPTHLALEIRSANINGGGKVLVDRQIVRTEAPGFELRVGSAGPLAARMLAKSGVTVESGGSITLGASDVAVDLSKLSGKSGTDLRAVAGLITVQTGPMAGRLTSAGQAPRAWDLAPLAATIDAKDLARGAAVKATGSARVDGQPAGAVDVDLVASGLVSPDGAVSAALPVLNGRVSITGVSTELAQPMVQASGLDLPAGIGPRLDVVIAAAGKPVPQGAAGPTTDLDLAIRSAGLTSAVGMTLDGRTLRQRGDAQLSLRSPGTLAGGAALKSGVELSTGGYVKLSSRDFVVRFDDHWKPLIGDSLADFELNVGGFALRPMGAPGAAPAAPADPVQINQMILAAKLTPGKPAAVNLRGSGTHQGAAFFVQGGLDLPGLIGPSGALTPMAVRPLGTIELNNIPTSLASLALAGRSAAPAAAPPNAPDPAVTPPSASKPALDLAALVRDAVGPTVTVKLDAAKAPSGGSEARDIALNITSARLTGQAAVGLSDTALSIRTVDFRDVVSPELAATLIDAAGPGLASRPTLAGPATLSLTMAPVTVPLKGFTPDFAGAGDASLRLGLEGRTTINNVVLAGKDGQRQDVGPIGLQDVLFSAQVPLGSLGAGGAAKEATLALSAAVLGGPEQRKVVDLTGGGKVMLASGGPAGNLDANLKLAIQDSRWIDTFLGQPGLVADGFGQTASLESAATVIFPPKQAGTAPAKAPAAAAYERVNITAAITSPRLATTQPLKATMLPDRLMIDSPMVVRWTMDPAWANAHALSPPKAGDAQVLAFTAPTEINLSVFRLSLATGAGRGPLAPGIFEADAEIASPAIALMVGPAGRAVPTRLTSFKTRVGGGKEPGTLGFSLSMEDAGGGPAPGGKPAVTMAGGIYNVADAQGKPAPGRALITMDGSAVQVPTVLVDAVAKQKGLIVEALGPTADLKVKATGLSRAAGDLTITASSPRAEAELATVNHGGAVTLRGNQQVARLDIVTPQLGAMIVSGLPQLGTFEKRREDGPAVVRTTDLSVPIDGDWRKLNGQIVLDFGQARFATSSVFGQLLKLTGQRNTETIGRRLQPITFECREGVISYDKVTIPLGEFNLATSGSVDLVHQTLDVVTYIPIGALTDEAAGAFNTDLGKILGGVIPALEQATMVPFRTSGPFKSPQTKPDMELFAKNFGRTMLRPDKAVGGALENLLKKLGPNQGGK